MSLTIYLDPAAQLRLDAIAKETGRKVEDLATAAVEEGALDFFRHRDDDPAKAARRLIEEVSD